MTDLIIGSYANYNWSQIKDWADSIDQSGFRGDKAMIVFDSDYDTVQRLLDRKFNIFAFNRDDSIKRFTYPVKFSIVVQRFYHLWQYLNNLPEDKKYKNVIATDVKDVIFQSNPSTWLDKNLGGKKILVSSESLRYRDEPWGSNNMLQSFPMLHTFMLDKNIWNCGVLAGNADVMKDFFLNIYLVSCGGPPQVPGGGGPDQAALNLLLNMETYKKITKFATSEDGWACQAGTTADPSKIVKFRPNLLEPEPSWDGEYATTSKGKRHAVLHQWDRVPEWKDVIEKRYQ
jgi:hypothetical protein